MMCKERGGSAGTQPGLVFDGTYTCGSTAAARINVTTWPSAARIRFVPVPARSVECSVSFVCRIPTCTNAVCRVGSCAGEYTLTGVWMSETQTWTLTPGAWLTNPCNYFMIGFSGTIDVVAGLRRFSGSVTFSGCTTFSLMEMDRTTGTPSPLFAHHL